MSRLWKTISPAEAKNHPLYGVKNWLAVFAFGVLLGALRELGSLNGAAHKADLTITELLAIDHPAISFAKTSLWLNAGIVSVIYWALLTKNSKFRIIASSLLLGSWPIGVLVGAILPFDGLGEALALSLIPWIISCSVWITYLNRSKRVRVTFEHQILSESIEPTIDSVVEPSPQTNAAETNGNAAQQSHRGTQDEDAIYERIAAELESGQMQRGLWTRLYAENGGDDTRTKVAYIRDRAARIATAEAAKLTQSMNAPTPVKIPDSVPVGPKLKYTPDPALIEAVWKGNWNTASVLLAQGKHISGVDSEGRTLLELAEIRNDKPMIELLRKYILG